MSSLQKAYYTFRIPVHTSMAFDDGFILDAIRETEQCQGAFVCLAKGKERPDLVLICRARGNVLLDDSGDTFAKKIYDTIAGSMPASTSPESDDAIAPPPTTAVSKKKTRATKQKNLLDELDVLEYFKDQEVKWCGISWSRGGAAGIGAKLFEGSFGAKYLCINVPFNKFKGGQPSKERAWVLVSKFWPGVYDLKSAQEKVIKWCPTDMTNLDIVHFPRFNHAMIRDEDDKASFTYTEEDTPEIAAHRKMCTFGTETFDPAKGREIFARYGRPGMGDETYAAYLASRGQRLTAIPQRPVPPPGIAPPVNSVAVAAAPVGQGDTDDLCSQLSTNMNVDDNDDEEEVPNSMPNGIDHAKLAQSSAKRAIEDGSVSTRPDASKKQREGASTAGVDDDNDDDVTHLSEDLLADSQAYNYGLFLELPEHIGVGDVKDAIAHAAPDTTSSKIKSVSLGTFGSKGRGVVVCGEPEIITTLDQYFVDESILGWSVTQHPISGKEWSDIQALPPNAAAEKFASDSTVQLCKRHCPQPYTESFARAIESASSVNDIFESFSTLKAKAASDKTTPGKAKLP